MMMMTGITKTRSCMKYVLPLSILLPIPCVVLHVLNVYRHDYMKFNLPPTLANCYTVFTYAFIHRNAPHLLVNITGFVVYTSFVEFRHGTPRAILIATSSAMWSALGYAWMWDPISGHRMLSGLSGVVYGMVGANVSSLALTWDDKHAFERIMIITIATCNIFTDIVIYVVMRPANIAHSAHCTGFISGWLMGNVIFHKEQMSWFFYLSCLCFAFLTCMGIVNLVITN